MTMVLKACVLIAKQYKIVHWSDAGPTSAAVVPALEECYMSIEGHSWQVKQYHCCITLSLTLH